MIKVGIACTRQSLETWFRSTLNDSNEFIVSFITKSFDKEFFENCLIEHDVLLFHSDMNDNSLGPLEFTLKKYFSQFKKPIVILLEKSNNVSVEKLKTEIPIVEVIYTDQFETIEMKDTVREALKIAGYVSHEAISSFTVESVVTESEQVEFEYQVFSLFKVLIIGASTGGPKVVFELLKGLNQSLKHFSVVLVQHISHVFLEQLKEELEKIVSVPVKIIRADMLIEKGVIYLTPVQRQYVLGSDMMFKPDPNRHLYPFMPNIDVMTESISRYFKNDVTFLLLSGLGKDGSIGAKKVIENEGTVIAQELTTTEVQSMPKSIIDNGDFNMILSPRDMIKYLNNQAATLN